MPDDPTPDRTTANDDADAGFLPGTESLSIDDHDSMIDAEDGADTVCDPEVTFAHAIRRPLTPAIAALPAMTVIPSLFSPAVALNSWILAVVLLVLLVLYPLALWIYYARSTRRSIPAHTQASQGYFGAERVALRSYALFCLMLWAILSVPGLAFLVVVGVGSAEMVSFIAFVAKVLILWAIAAAGVYLVTAGFLSTQGNDLRCGKCGYDFGKNLFQRCPECGQYWSEASPLIAGRVVRNPRKIGAGIAVLALCWLLLLPSVRLPDTMTPRLPTAVLLNRAASLQAPPNNSIWDELLSRSLTPTEEERLTDAMLRQATNNQIWGADGTINQWLEDRFLSEQMTEYQIERFESAVFGATLSVPRETGSQSRTSGGTEYTIRMWLNLSGFYSSMSRKAYVLSLDINGTPIETSGRPRRTRSPSVQLARVHPAMLPETRRLTIEADVVLLLLPDTTTVPERLELDDNGDPILPDDTLLHRRVTLSRTVDNPAR